MSHYRQMYSGSQLGRGFGEIDVYTGPRYRGQLGRGRFGSFFMRAYKYLRPLVSSGINAVKQQGIDSTGNIIKQLGTKDIKSILEDEGERALKNLGKKAINKIGRTVQKVSQSGKGIDHTMSNGLSLLQLQRLRNNISTLRRKKSIKSQRVIKKPHSSLKRRVGSFKRIQKRKYQLGGRRRKKNCKSCTNKSQIGGKRKRKSKNKNSKKRKVQLDIFN